MNNTIKKLLIVGLASVAVCSTALAIPRGATAGRMPARVTARQKAEALRRTKPAVKQAKIAQKTQARLAARPPRFAAPVRPKGHVPCGRLHPHGHHIGPRHVRIYPPLVIVSSYYWTEEVYIDGEYYILYCYPDGTKRFSDGTIYSYIVY